MSFKKAYDRVFREFKDKLTQEYALMRNSYLNEYENNYQQNQREKEKNVDEGNTAISDKEQEI